MPTVFLVRHGRTPANASGVLTGRSSVRLDDRGVRQAQAAGRRLRSVPLEAIVASPLSRTRQTATLIRNELPAPVPVKRDDGLLEVDYGDWAGRTLAELAKHDLWRVVQEHPSGMVFPGGESLAGAQHRAVDAIRSMNRRWTTCYAVVSHGDVIKAILADALGMHLDQFQRIVIDPGSISVVHYGDTRPSVLATNITQGPLRFHRRISSVAAVGGGSGS